MKYTLMMENVCEGETAYCLSVAENKKRKVRGSCQQNRAKCKNCRAIRKMIDKTFKNWNE